MISRKWLIVVLVVVFFLFGIFGAYAFLKARTLGILPFFNKGPVAQKGSSSVISWDPALAELVYLDEKQAQQQIIIKPLKPMVIVPIYENGKLVKEELALTPRAQYWKTAFCPGDALSFEMNETGEIKTIRNKGLRQCEE